MIEIPVYRMDPQRGGTERIGAEQLDPALLGGEVRPKLLKQAVVMYQANARQNTVATKNRSKVEGSTRKLYRQKGTGNARMGAVRTNLRRGGGVTFCKGGQLYTQDLPKKMRRLARNNAILAKAESGDVVIVEGLTFEKPRTKMFATLLSAVGGERGCVVALGSFDHNTHLSGRNIPKTEVKPVRELNAYDILRRRKLIFTRDAFQSLRDDPVLLGAREGDKPAVEEKAAKPVKAAKAEKSPKAAKSPKTGKGAAPSAAKR
jgi:large subunit ribosomal protein L4